MQLTRSISRARVAAVWALAMVWHLWRIATVRPAFAYMADDQRTVASFASVFVVAGLLRHWIFGPADFFGAVGTLALNVLMLLILFERSNRASTLVAACMGVSALSDMLVIALEQSGLVPGVGKVHGMFYAEVGFMLIQRHVFLRQPAAVRARGYKPPRESA
ncbi:MAG: hypothetical protein Q7V53_02795 [Caldisericota bacterium]|nr:hypothetical protein [Caldisericota bacterium]